LLIDFDPPNTVASTSRKPELELSSCGRHLENITSYFHNYGDKAETEKYDGVKTKNCLLAVYWYVSS